MSEQAREVIAGVSVLGSWTTYSPVFYRIYVEVDSINAGGKRRPIVAISRMGFLALLAALASKKVEPKLHLVLIAPLSLATIDKGSGAEVRQVLTHSWPHCFCEHVVEGLKAYSRPVHSAELTIGGDGLKLLRNGRVEDSIRLSTLAIDDIILVKGIECLTRSPNYSGESSSQSRFPLPETCSYECEIYYEHACHRGGEGQTGSQNTISSEQPESCGSNTSLKTTIDIVIVPVMLASSVRNGDIVIFREREPGSIGVSEVIQASIVEGLTRTLVERLTNDLQEEEHGVRATVFYDTTHGFNVIVSELAKTVRLVDSITVLRLLASALRSRGEKGFSYKSYLYNSDPAIPRIQRGGGGWLRDWDTLSNTCKYNVSYYYAKVLDNIALWREGLEEKNGSLSQSVVLHLIKGLTTVGIEIRSFIDLYAPQVCGDRVRVSASLGTAAAGGVVQEGILAGYLVKIGLIPWALASLQKLRGASTGLTRMYTVAFSVRSGEKVLNVVYDARRGVEGSFTDPHDIIGLNLVKALSDYMLSLHDNMLVLKPKNVGEPLLCVSLDRLKSLYSSLDEKLGILKNIKEDYSRYAFLLLSAELLTNIIEPGMRTIIFNELESILSTTDISRLLDHFLPRGMRLDVEGCENLEVKSISLSQEPGGSRAFCVNPMVEAPHEMRHVRNFIAHGGFTRLSKDWCLALSLSSSGGGEANGRRCRPVAMCIRKPLPMDILCKLAFQRPSNQSAEAGP